MRPPFNHSLIIIIEINTCFLWVKQFVIFKCKNTILCHCAIPNHRKNISSCRFIMCQRTALRRVIGRGCEDGGRRIEGIPESPDKFGCEWEIDKRLSALYKTQPQQTERRCCFQPCVHIDKEGEGCVSKGLFVCIYRHNSSSATKRHDTTMASRTPIKHITIGEECV